MLFHITEQAAWQQAQLAGVYRALSLKTEGFIHLSEASQVLGTAARFYQGQPGLVLLGIDPARLTAELSYETVLDHGIFPHLYGPLNLAAVVQVWFFSPNENGCFELPG